MGVNGESKRDIAIVFRGTEAITEWKSDFVSEMQPWDDLQQFAPGEPRIPVMVAKVSLSKSTACSSYQ